MGIDKRFKIFVELIFKGILGLFIVFFNRLYIGVRISLVGCDLGVRYCVFRNFFYLYVGFWIFRKKKG